LAFLLKLLHEILRLSQSSTGTDCFYDFENSGGAQVNCLRITPKRGVICSIHDLMDAVG
jgi:hypothetical protein